MHHLREVGRYYDPGTGQFLTVDPLIEQTGQPYAYTGDDPVDQTDPLGLCASPGVSRALASALAITCEGPECFQGAGGPYEGSEIAEAKARAGYLRSQNDRLSQLTRNQLNKLMGSSQRGLIGKWFGNSVAGAQEALEGPADPGSEITNETLQIYRQLALRSIAVGKDTLGVQALRLRLVERALTYRFEEESFYR